MWLYFRGTFILRSMRLKVSDLNREVVRTSYFRGSMYSTDIPDVLDDTQLQKGALLSKLEQKKMIKAINANIAETCRSFFRVKLGISRRKQIMLLYSSPKEVRTTNEWLLLSLWLKVVGRSMFQPSLGYFFIACMQLNAF